MRFLHPLTVGINIFSREHKILFFEGVPLPVPKPAEGGDGRKEAKSNGTNTVSKTDPVAVLEARLQNDTLPSLRQSLGLKTGDPFPAGIAKEVSFLEGQMRDYKNYKRAEAMLSALLNAFEIRHGLTSMASRKTGEVIPTSLAVVNERAIELQNIVNKAWDMRGTYMEISTMVGNKLGKIGYEGVRHIPWYLIAAIHYRENSSLNTNVYLHNGQTLGSPTDIVPKAIFFKQGQFKEAAVDAIIRQVKSGNFLPGESIPAMATFAEKYNGLGYAFKGQNSSYTLAATSFAPQGKYTSDGKLDVRAQDKQIGVLPLIIALKDRENLTINKLPKTMEAGLTGTLNPMG